VLVEVGGQRHPWQLHSRQRGLVPIVWLAGWMPGPGRTSAEDIAPTGIRSTDFASRHAGNNNKKIINSSIANEKQRVWSNLLQTDQTASVFWLRGAGQ